VRLRTKAPAKINVCLFLGPIRADGRHELVSVMQSVSLSDRLVLEAIDGPDEVVCPGVEGENLVATAIARFREAGYAGPASAGGKLGGFRITIDKRIPVAGGMAGGSADAGAALRLLARAVGLRDQEVLVRIAVGLGADVPHAVHPGRVLATGAGEVIERVPGAGPYAVVVVPDDGPMSTPVVFREADRLGLGRDAAGLGLAMAQVRAGLPDLPDELCVNELEPATLSLRPALGSRLELLRAAGADVAMVSGSGPTVLGLFRDVDLARAVAERFAGARIARPVGPHAGEVLPA
jgi:4-diphosphocytidyl-2-C-methyl-D-erythritol kinase